MKRVLVSLLVLGSIVMSAGIAHASSYLDDATDGLNKSTLYVAPDASISSDQQIQLQEQLQKNDSIRIAILPAAAANDPEDVQKFATALEARIKNPSIVVVAIGSEIKASADQWLPAGVSSSLITSASTVATTTFEALTIFIKDVHQYQKENPTLGLLQKTPPEKPSFSWWPIIFGFFGVAILIAAFLFYRRTKLSAIPGEVSRLLERISERSDQISSWAVQQHLDLIEQRVRDLFSGDNDRNELKNREAEIVPSLERIAHMVDGYAKIEASPVHAPEAKRAMAKAEQSFEAYGHELNRAIIRAHRGEVIKLDVDADVLSNNF